MIQIMMTQITMIQTMIKQKPDLTLRHEMKHTITKVEEWELSKRLRKLFPHDPHADSHGSYRVSSLYFDTPNDKALRQKIDGINHREKFRLRYYGNTPTFIRLEKKIKTNGLAAKQSATLTIEETKELLKGNIDFLLKSDHHLLIELYSKMRGERLQPKTIVSYEREAFVYIPGNVRVTLDRNLKSGLYRTDFLNPNLHEVSVSDELTVLEVKYDAFLPDIVRMAVQTQHQRTVAYSKYQIARRYD